MIVQNKPATSDLVAQLKTRKKYAFSVLYDQYAQVLLGVAIKIVRDRQVGEDILQEVFVKIWKHIDTYDASKGTLFTWMLNITKNTSKDYLRSKHYHNQLHIVGNGLESVENYAVAWHSNYKDEPQEIPSLLQNLDVKYREIIDLVYIYGYTQEVVAEMLDIPVGTVKTRCRAALKQIKIYYNI